MAKRYDVKLTGYALVDGVKQGCYVVIDSNAHGAGRVVWPAAGDETCYTRAAAQTQADVLNGV